MVEAGIVVPVDGEPPSYRFRHHLLGDLAYDTQLRPRGQRAHAAIADALRSGASVGVAAAPAVVAHHLEQAGRIAEAVEALMEAAEEALALGAYAEVASLVARALDLVPAAPADRQADLEFRVRLLRGTSVSSTLGFAAPDAIVDFEACQELAGTVQRGGLHRRAGPGRSDPRLRPRVHRDRALGQPAHPGPHRRRRGDQRQPHHPVPPGRDGPQPRHRRRRCPRPLLPGGLRAGGRRCSRT